MPPAVAANHRDFAGAAGDLATISFRSR